MHEVVDQTKREEVDLHAKPTHTKHKHAHHGRMTEKRRWHKLSTRKENAVAYALLSVRHNDLGHDLLAHLLR